MCAASHDRSASSSRKRLRRDEVVRSAVSEIAATLDASQDTEYPDTWVRWVGSAETGRASEQMGAIHDDVMAAMRWTRNAFTYMPHPRQAGGQRLLSGLMCVLKAMQEINGLVREKEEKRIMLMLWEWWFHLVFEKLRNGPEQAVAASATHVQTVGRQSQCRRQSRRGCRPGVKSEVSCQLHTIIIVPSTPSSSPQGPPGQDGQPAR